MAYMYQKACIINMHTRYLQYLVPHLNYCTVITDHKALLGLFVEGKPISSQALVRIHNWTFVFIFEY